MAPHGPDQQLQTFEAGKDAAARLNASRAHILEKWERRARKELTAARAQDQATLVDNLPVVLAEMADALEASGTAQREIREREQVLGQTHGVERALLDEYDIDQMLHEYTILQQVILETLERDRPLSTEARSLVLDVLQIGIRGATTSFAQRREMERLRQQTERDDLLAREKAAREELERQKALLDLIIEQSGDGVIVTDEKGTIRVFNPEAQRQHGRGKHEVGAEDWTSTYELLTEDERPMPLEAAPLYRALHGEKVRDTTFKVRTPSGEIRLLSGTAAPLVRSDGTSAGAVFFSRDETERRHAEEELRRREREYRALAELMPQIVWSAREDGHLDYVNPVFANFVGLPPQALLEMSWIDLIAPEDRGVTLQRWEEAVRTGDFYSMEQRVRRVDGTYRWHLTRAAALKDANGRVLKWFGTATDIEELKQAEMAAQKRAEFERQLVGIVSHDLRNPMAAILMGCAALLHRTDLDERHLKSILRIQSAADRANRLVRDLLDFTRVRLGGALPIHRDPLDLHGLARQVVEEQQIVYPEREIRISHLGDGHGHWDADRLTQVLTNLISNAVTYSPPGTPVSVFIDPRGEDVELRVHNGGDPIPHELVPKLFEPLERGTHDDTGSRNIGLGLFIVKHVVQAHGGTIEVHSSTEGTIFSVRLPRK